MNDTTQTTITDLYGKLMDIRAWAVENAGRQDFVDALDNQLAELTDAVEKPAEQTTVTPTAVLARLRAMKVQQDSGSYFDPEGQHEEADDLIYALLRSLDQSEVADLLKELRRNWWYS